MYRLSENDRRVLGCVEKDFRLSAPEVAKASRVRTHTVLHSLRRLREAEILKPYLLTNPHVLGLTDYCVFFNYVGEEKRARRKVIEFCLRSPVVSYFAELSGPYQFTVSLFCKTIFEVERFFERLRSLLPKSSFDSSFANRLEFTQFLGKGVLMAPHPTTLARVEPNALFEYDEADIRILGYYSQHASEPLRKVAAFVGLSESGVRSRLRRLEECGVIIAFPYRLNLRRLGMTSFRILIASRGPLNTLQKSLFLYASRHRWCSAFIRCTGAWDFELNFDVPTSPSPGEILEEVHDHFSENIRSMHTLMELEVHRGHHFPIRHK